MRSFFCRSTSFFESFELEVSPRSLPLSVVPPTLSSGYRRYIPSSFAPVLRMHGGELELSLARWRGTPTRANRHGESSRNANALQRSESIFKSRNAPDISGTERCLVPAEGWYEWGRKVASQGKWEIVPKNGELVFFAGVLRSSDRSKAPKYAEFSIVTEPASQSIPGLDRAPVVLWGSDRLVWLDPKSTHRQLRDLFGAESPDIFNAKLVGGPRKSACKDGKVAPMRRPLGKKATYWRSNWLDSCGLLKHWRLQVEYLKRLATGWTWEDNVALFPRCHHSKGFPAINFTSAFRRTDRISTAMTRFWRKADMGRIRS